MIAKGILLTKNKSAQMNKIISFTIIFTLVLSCTSNTIYKKPHNLIERELMVELITQMQLANGARSSKNKNGVRKIEYMSVVYKNFGIDSVRFAESNLYYSSKIDEYADIFQEVQRNLDALNEKYEALKEIQDSVKRMERKEIREKNKTNREKNELLQPRGVTESNK
jgi:ribosomal protein S20